VVRDDRPREHHSRPLNSRSRVLGVIHSDRVDRMGSPGDGSLAINELPGRPVVREQGHLDHDS
jgi:hypothetical protein